LEICEKSARRNPRNQNLWSAETALKQGFGHLDSDKTDYVSSADPSATWVHLHYDLNIIAHPKQKIKPFCRILFILLTKSKYCAIVSVVKTLKIGEYHYDIDLFAKRILLRN